MHEYAVTVTQVFKNLNRLYWSWGCLWLWFLYQSDKNFACPDGGLYVGKESSEFLKSTPRQKFKERKPQTHWNYSPLQNPCSDLAHIKFVLLLKIFLYNIFWQLKFLIYISQPVTISDQLIIYRLWREINCSPSSSATLNEQISSCHCPASTPVWTDLVRMWNWVLSHRPIVWRKLVDRLELRGIETLLSSFL